jgi:glycosyltransferase involved in cell wall biosynthesis
VNTWLHPRFIPRHLPLVATLHHAVHHPDARGYKGFARTFYHRGWIVPNERRVLHRADRVIAVSRFVADTARVTLADVPMRVIYNGIDTDAFQPSKHKGRARAPFRLLYVGSWMARKGVDLLAPIMRELGSEFELHYTGGAAADRDKSGMPPNMHDLGHLAEESEVVAAMQGADAFLFPSRSEGFGLVVAEAMACGLPAVVTRGSSLMEIVEDSETGLLCESGNVRAFADAIRVLAAEPTRTQAMSLAASRSVLRCFGFQSMVESYIATYHDLLWHRV